MPFISYCRISVENVLVSRILHLYVSWSQEKRFSYIVKMVDILAVMKCRIAGSIYYQVDFFGEWWGELISKSLISLISRIIQKGLKTSLELVLGSISKIAWAPFDSPFFILHQCNIVTINRIFILSFIISAVVPASSHLIMNCTFQL